MLSGEHDGVQWVRAEDVRALLSEDFIAAVADGDERIGSLLGWIAADLDRYLKLTGAQLVGATVALTRSEISWRPTVAWALGVERAALIRRGEITAWGDPA